jgi:hypothetical protein
MKQIVIVECEKPVVIVLKEDYDKLVSRAERSTEDLREIARDTHLKMAQKIRLMKTITPQALADFLEERVLTRINDYV